MQALINETLKSAINGSTEFEQILIDSGYEKSAVALAENPIYLEMDEKQQTSAARKLTDYYYAVAYSKISGGDYDNKYKLYEKIGIDKVAVYLIEISAIESDKEDNGKTVAGSRKKKVLQYIEQLKLSATQKYILLYLAGYSLSDDIKAQLSQLGIEL